MDNTNKKVIATIVFTHNATQNARTLTKYEDNTFSNDFDNAPISRYKNLSFYIYQTIDGAKLQLATKYSQDIEKLIDEYRDYIKNEKALAKAIKEHEKKQSKENKQQTKKDNFVFNREYDGTEPIFDSVEKMLAYDDIDKIPGAITVLQRKHKIRKGVESDDIILSKYTNDLQQAKIVVEQCEKALENAKNDLAQTKKMSETDFLATCIEVMKTHNQATIDRQKSKITKNELFDENARLREMIAKLQAQAQPTK